MDSSPDILPENDQEMVSDGEVAKEMLLSKIDEAVAVSALTAPLLSVGENVTPPQPTTSSPPTKVFNPFHNEFLLTTSFVPMSAI